MINLAPRKVRCSWSKQAPWLRGGRCDIGLECPEMSHFCFFRDGIRRQEVYCFCVFLVSSIFFWPLCRLCSVLEGQADGTLACNAQRCPICPISASWGGVTFETLFLFAAWFRDPWVRLLTAEGAENAERNRDRSWEKIGRWCTTFMQLGS